MIAVIADDFTGAAEIGGVGIRNGFRVVIDTKVHRNVEADILVIATDTRSQHADKAAARIRETTLDLLALHPDFIYKKTDSVFRGNVGEELLAQLSVSTQKRALLIPANPELKRTIRAGVYYHDGIPLNAFSFGSEIAEKTSSPLVMDLIGESARTHATVITTEDNLPERGIMIGDTSSSADLEKWAGKIDGKTIPSGGAEFFDAILRNRKAPGTRAVEGAQLGEKVLYVCGSAFDKSRLLVKAAREAGQEVIYMPEKLFSPEEQYDSLIAEWAGAINDGLNRKNKVIIAIDRLDKDDVGRVPAKVKNAMADVVARLFSQTKISELIIEGGATSFAIIQKLDFARFYPVQELGAGAIRMRIAGLEDLFLTLKPGSYAWPGSIWEYPEDHPARKDSL